MWLYKYAIIILIIIIPFLIWAIIRKKIKKIFKYGFFLLVHLLIVYLITRFTYYEWHEPPIYLMVDFEEYEEYFLNVIPLFDDKEIGVGVSTDDNVFNGWIPTTEVSPYSITLSNEDINNFTLLHQKTGVNWVDKTEYGIWFGWGFINIYYTDKSLDELISENERFTFYKPIYGNWVCHVMDHPRKGAEIAFYRYDE